VLLSTALRVVWVRATRSATVIAARIIRNRRADFADEVSSRLRRRGRVDVHFGFLLLSRSCWRRIYDRSITFFFLCRRIIYGCFLLLASRQQCHAGEQTNVFFHTNHSYFEGKVAVSAGLYCFSFAIELTRACFHPCQTTDSGSSGDTVITMTRLGFKGTWNELKGKLKQKYAQLSDDDLTFAEGKEDELLGRLQQKLGKSKEDLRREIESL
jgi:uncharacterized protein YjbJ (UPF0337 family)